MPDSVVRRGQAPWLLIIALLALFTCAAATLFFLKRAQRPLPPDVPVVQPKESIEQQVHHFCGGCHLYPPADTFRKKDWKDEVERGYVFFNSAGKNLRPPPIDDVVKYYEERAADELPRIDATPAAHAAPVTFSQIPIPGPATPEPYAISHVNIVPLLDAKRPDILACDMRNGLVMAWPPYAEKPAWRILGQVANPAHAEVVDLDGDGIRDVLVASLGSFRPTDSRVGSVVWLRGRRDGGFTAIPLLVDVGRVADVQAADFRGTGKLDLVVACFGWNRIGEVIHLENHTTDWSKPKFTPRILDERHGSIHVPVVDLNGDGTPDFVTVIAQEHETVVAFLNDGKGGFHKETIYQAPHPAYGSSGIQLTDMNGDGKLDVLYSNGDTLDQPFLLKHYHGVQWLENPGANRFPWKRHVVAPMYGVHRALAADFCGRGKADVLAVSFLPVETFPQRHKLNLDAVLLLERSGPATFARHPLQSVNCDYTSCATGDLYGTGRPDFVTGAFTGTRQEHAVTIWKNLGPLKK